jgi:protein-tyrosine sulfotransferase
MSEEAEKIKNIQMLFILGKGRSGTSLLQNMLNAHPAVVGPPESKFAVIFYPKFAHIKKWTEKDVLNFIECLYSEALFAGVWNVDKKVLTEKLLAIKDEADYGLLCKAVYYMVRKSKENVLYISEKNPQYILFIDTLLKIFPQARFVHIVREPRDNIYSHLISFNEKNTIFRAYQWVAFNSIIEEAKKRLQGRFFSLKYEELVNETEKNMRGLCDFLHIPFMPEITQNRPPEALEGDSLKGELMEQARVIHKELLKPINTSNIGKWKQGMSEFDRTATEIITADYARKTYGCDIDAKSEGGTGISSFRLMRGRWLYYTWQTFTRWRYKNYTINLTYSRIKRSIMKDKLAVWEYF